MAKPRVTLLRPTVDRGLVQRRRRGVSPSPEGGSRDVESRRRFQASRGVMSKRVQGRHTDLQHKGPLTALPSDPRNPLRRNPTRLVSLTAGSRIPSLREWTHTTETPWLSRIGPYVKSRIEGIINGVVEFLNGVIKMPYGLSGALEPVTPEGVIPDRKPFDPFRLGISLAVATNDPPAPPPGAKPPGDGGGRSDTASLVASAQLAIQLGRLAEARITADRVLENGDTFEAQLLLAESFAADPRSKPRAIDRALAQARRANPGAERDLRYQLVYVRILARQNKSSEAKAALATAVDDGSLDYAMTAYTTAAMAKHESPELASSARLFLARLTGRESSIAPYIADGVRLYIVVEEFRRGHTAGEARTLLELVLSHADVGATFKTAVDIIMVNLDGEGGSLDLRDALALFDIAATNPQITNRADYWKTLYFKLSQADSEHPMNIPLALRWRRAATSDKARETAMDLSYDMVMNVLFQFDISDAPNSTRDLASLEKLLSALEGQLGLFDNEERGALRILLAQMQIQNAESPGTFDGALIARLLTEAESIQSPPEITPDPATVFSEKIRAAKINISLGRIAPAYFLLLSTWLDPETNHYSWELRNLYLDIANLYHRYPSDFASLVPGLEAALDDIKNRREAISLPLGDEYLFVRASLQFYAGRFAEAEETLQVVGNKDGLDYALSNFMLYGLYAAQSRQQQEESGVRQGPDRAAQHVDWIQRTLQLIPQQGTKAEGRLRNQLQLTLADYDLANRRYSDGLLKLETVAADPQTPHQYRIRALVSARQAYDWLLAKRDFENAYGLMNLVLRYTPEDLGPFVTDTLDLALQYSHHNDLGYQRVGELLHTYVHRSSDVADRHNTWHRLFHQLSGAPAPIFYEIVMRWRQDVQSSEFEADVLEASSELLQTSFREGLAGDGSMAHQLLSRRPDTPFFDPIIDAFEGRLDLLSYQEAQTLSKTIIFLRDIAAEYGVVNDRVEGFLTQIQMRQPQ